MFIAAVFPMVALLAGLVLSDVPKGTQVNMDQVEVNGNGGLPHVSRTHFAASLQQSPDDVWVS